MEPPLRKATAFLPTLTPPSPSVPFLSTHVSPCLSFSLPYTLPKSAQQFPLTWTPASLILSPPDCPSLTILANHFGYLMWVSTCPSPHSTLLFLLAPQTSQPTHRESCHSGFLSSFCHVPSCVPWVLLSGPDSRASLCGVAATSHVRAFVTVDCSPSSSLLSIIHRMTMKRGEWQCAPGFCSRFSGEREGKCSTSNGCRSRASADSMQRYYLGNQLRPEGQLSTPWDPLLSHQAKPQT